MTSRIRPVILSGGAGTRLWPLSTAAHPKQLQALIGERTMLQETALRWRGETPPLVVCGLGHVAAITAQLAAVDIDAPELIVEPVARNTAPAVAYAACHIAASDPGDILLVMPSDHVVADPAAFAAAVERAQPAVDDGWLVTFGIAPTAPETGYGYIESGDAIAPGVHAARRFVEKPDRDRAAAMLACGRYSWNAGIFMFRADSFVEALATHAPEVLDAVRAAAAGASRDGGLIHPAATAFAAAPSISIDYAVMEKAKRVAVVPVDMGWSDIGSWPAVHAHGEADATGNVVQGAAVLVETKNCLIRSDGPLVATLGVDGLIVVVSDGKILVAAASHAQAVRDIVARLP